MPEEEEAAHDGSVHEQLREDGARWITLPFVGIQRGAAGLSYALELRNCTCGSTLGRRVKEQYRRFEVYEDTLSSEFRWRLLASDGQVVADSGESYRRREDVHRAIVALQASVITARIADA